MHPRMACWDCQVFWVDRGGDSACWVCAKPGRLTGENVLDRPGAHHYEMSRLVVYGRQMEWHIDNTEEARPW